MVSWQEWHYCGCDDPTTSGPGDLQALVKDPTKPPRRDNVFRDKLRALARPYPQLVSGTPQSWSFDPATRRFELTYSLKRAAAGGRFRGGRSIVFLPRIQYGAKPRVRATGVRASRRGPLLVLRADRGAKRVSVVVTPR
jgi:endoglycosylceramidase